ncbi:MAG: hypothetical protein HC835_20185 [Oscillatoriales cyanobacterium RM2_1_1]|nr:hypothetical protein [Oscillatoriales cyanobacterium RM2_1_1]
MIRQFTFLLSGVLGLTLIGGAISPAIAQSRFPQESRLERQAEKLNLTDTQRTQMQEIWQSTRDRLQTVLTNEQKNQLQTARQQGDKRREAFRNLNLSDAQKEQVRAIRQDTQQRIQGILTPEQQQQLEQMRQQRQEGRQNGQLR